MRIRNLELLDIYHMKDRDIIRYKDRATNKVYLYASKKRVRDLTDLKEIDALVEDLIKYMHQS